MLTVISPAKTLDFATPAGTRKATQPRFLPRSAELVEDARALSPAGIGELMGVSDAIARLNHRRFREWATPFSTGNAKQAVLAFRGDVYTGLDADSLDGRALDFAQRHLRILSGLYGLLRPLDLIQAYRLEMGLRFPNRGGRNLYEFWGDTISDEIRRALRAAGGRTLVNLASVEYFRAVRPARLDARVITPVFKERKGGSYSIVSFYAKKARGRMARFIIDHRLSEADDLKAYNLDGYRFNGSLSGTSEWVFSRDAPPASP